MQKINITVLPPGGPGARQYLCRDWGGGWGWRVEVSRWGRAEVAAYPRPIPDRQGSAPGYGWPGPGQNFRPVLKNTRTGTTTRPTNELLNFSLS